MIISKIKCRLVRARFGLTMLGIVLSLGIGASLALGKKPEPADFAARSIQIDVTPINRFSRVNPLQNRFGKLRFLGGLVLSSPLKRFGGWSDIVVDPDGKRLLAISDLGLWMTAGLNYRGNKLSGLIKPRIGSLRARSGRLLRGKKERDAEGLELVSGTIAKGRLLVSFERIHRIGHFRISDRDGVVGPSRYIKLPKKIRKKLKKNKGLESIAVLKRGPLKGAIVTFGERPRGDGNRKGWILHDGDVEKIKLRDIDGYDVTALAAMPDGGALVLERRFRRKEWFKGVRVRLRRISADELIDGGKITGDILMSANFSHEIDNMEGLSVHAGAPGETIITMISDDNFNRLLQRTILLQFSLREGSGARADRGN